MTNAPSLLSPLANPRINEAPAAVQPSSLVNMLYDGFYMVTLLKNRHFPESAEAFFNSIVKFLDQFERTAKKLNYSAEDIYDAKYAFCAMADEAVLSSQLNIRSTWERKPLQLALFGEQLAGDHFFDNLERARNDGARRIQALEVFHMCLLTGFKGRYLLEGPEKLRYLTTQLGEQLAHLKGKPAGFAPHWSAPDSISHVIRREVPLWVIGAVLALFGLAAWLALDWHAARAVRDTLSPFKNIVQLTPPAPTLHIILP